ncbi:MAG: pyruvate synthase subunit beta, partial [Candidatus Hermodarchaeota archaeon]
VSEPLDIYEKFKKAKSIEGCKYIHILASCPPGWGIASEESVEIPRLAVKTGSWILYEIENGVLTLSKKSKPLLDPSKRAPLIDYLSRQKRFSKLSEKALIELQESLDLEWSKIADELSCQEPH